MSLEERKWLVRHLLVQASTETKKSGSVKELLQTLKTKTEAGQRQPVWSMSLQEALVITV